MPPTPPAVPSPLQDGRTTRSLRTRRSIVDALLDLLEEGDLRPTAERIAERAGVSVRSIFQHFDDIEGLFAQASDRETERFAARVQRIPLAASREARVEAFVSQRGGLYEAIGAVVRAAHLHEPFSPAVHRRLRSFRNLSRREIERVFAAELAGRTGSDRRELLEALTASASWGAWEGLRMHARLSRLRSQAILRRTLLALLEGPKR